MKDRLAWWYHDSDRQALKQAVAIAVAQPGLIDFAELKRWSHGEGCGDAFDAILPSLESR